MTRKNGGTDDLSLKWTWEGIAWNLRSVGGLNCDNTWRPIYQQYCGTLILRLNSIDGILNLFTDFFGGAGILLDQDLQRDSGGKFCAGLPSTLPRDLQPQFCCTRFLYGEGPRLHHIALA